MDSEGLTAMQIENIDQARDNYDRAWNDLQEAKQAVKDAQAAADQAEIAWGDASATLQRFERDAVAARAVMLAEKISDE